MLELRAATVTYGDLIALDAVSLAVDDAEVVAVLGPSGSGKTTLLRVVAGLERPSAGSVHWDGTDLAPIPPHRRDFGLVFQDFALFPHLDVGGNVAFGLRMQGVPPSEREERVAEALERVDLSGFEGRSIGTLSGGQAQRVALARALAPRPRMLLFDEPLGSLDRALRDRLAGEIDEALHRLGITALYVTHDQDEAFAVADRVAIVDEGALLQVGTPEALYREPASARVAAILGMENVLEAVVEGSWAETPIGAVPVPPGTTPGPLRVVIRPDGLAVDPGGAIEATVVGRRFRGTGYLVAVEASGIILEFEARHAPPLGTGVRLTVEPAAVVTVR
jgi:thiamine transport system ATP-binding protein